MSLDVSISYTKANSILTVVKGVSNLADRTMDTTSDVQGIDILLSTEENLMTARQLVTT
jgi:hypothetical protein